VPSVFFPNFLIGLREGLEAGLVVSILVAFLVKSGRTEKLRWVALGVTGAVLFSVGSWFCITYIFTNIDSFRQQELTGGLLSLIAVVFVTGMIFWMRSTGRKLKKELSSKLEAALAVGSLAVVVMSFLAVGREGLETSIFIWSASQAAGQQVYPLLGALSGIATSVVLAYLIYRSAVKINLSKFFTVTGVGLIVVAAGIAGYGVHDLQEANYVPGLGHLAWDISSFYDESSWYGALLGGVFNVKAQTTVLQAIVFFAYLVVVTTFFLWPHGKTVKPAPTPEAADAESERTDKGVLEPAGAGTRAPQ
jgi:high-affinity iron transporter